MRSLPFFASAAVLALSQIMFSSCGSESDQNMSVLDKINLIPVTTSMDGRWSMINDKGEIVYDSEFKNEPTAAYNGLFSVAEEDGYTVYKIGGKLPKAVPGLEGLMCVGYFEDGLLPVTIPGQRISMADADGNIKFQLNPIKGKEITSCAPGFSEGLLCFGTEDGKYGYVNKSGEVVIQPVFDFVSDFSDGLAVVGKSQNDSDDSEMVCMVIDKSGNEVFKLKKGCVLGAWEFHDGYLPVRVEDRNYMYNKKGEEIKLPAKIKYVKGYNDRYIIFEGSDGEYGLADMQGEVVVRPKYDRMYFGNGDFVLAMKDSGDDEWVKISFNGEESKEKIDYERIYVAGHFGYFAKERNTYMLLDDNFKEKGKETFYDFSTSIWSGKDIESDYLNIEGVASEMVKIIDDAKADGIMAGASASKVMKGKSPEDYAYTSRVDFDKLAKKGFRYNISVWGDFSGYMAEYDYDYSTYSGNYYWSPSSKLSELSINLSVQSSWGEKGQEALKKALQAAGYTMIVEGMTSVDEMAAAFKKGNILVVAYSYEYGYSDGRLCVLEYTDDALKNIKYRIKSGDGLDDEPEYIEPEVIYVPEEETWDVTDIDSVMIP